MSASVFGPFVKPAGLTLKTFDAISQSKTITRPSILCVTHQINHKRRNYSAVPYEMMNHKWYQQAVTSG